MSKINFWKITFLFLLIVTFFVFYKFIKERQKNLSIKNEIKSIEISLKKSKLENQQLEKQIVANQDPLTQEKERKDKFGESLEGETMIFLYKEVLDSLTLPIFKKQK